jgi:NTE family protein
MTSGRRTGVVLGAGGVLGAAWTIGALCALEEVEGFDPRAADVIVGTSAGSILGALLGAGVPAGSLRDHQLGLPIDGLEYDYESGSGGATPGRPRLGIGSPALLWRTARHPLQVTPMAALASVLPPGRGSLASIASLIDDVTGPDGWSQHPKLWVVAMDFDTGRRAVFGRDDAPRVLLSDAVSASCAIPGWFTPVVIDGRRYVDGGAYSQTSADLLAGLGLDEVYVLAPMAAFVDDRPSAVFQRLERRWRQQTTRRMVRECDRVRDSGTDVTMIAPGPEDLAAFGPNVMDPSRRELVLDTALRTTRTALRRTGSASEAG